MRQPAAVLEFQRRPATPRQPRHSLVDLLARIERSCQWLSSRQLSVLSFGGSTFDNPVVVIASSPRAYAVFSGRYERKGFCQDGALRHEIWEATDTCNQVRVRWEEVVACGS